MELIDWVLNESDVLTPVQEHMTRWHDKNGSLIGVARPVGRSVYFPLVRRGKGPLSVIDTAGHEQLAANLSGKCPK